MTTTVSVTGPDFIALQVRDVDAAAAFYETHLGLRRAPASPPAPWCSRPSRSHSLSAKPCRA